jgi:hypothetical protein
MLISIDGTHHIYVYNTIYAFSTNPVISIGPLHCMMHVYTNKNELYIPYARIIIHNVPVDKYNYVVRVIAETVPVDFIGPQIMIDEDTYETTAMIGTTL